MSRYCIFDLTGWCWNTFFSDISPLLESGLLHEKRFFFSFGISIDQMNRWFCWCRCCIDFPGRGCKYCLVSSFQRCCSSSELSVCISTSLQHPGLSVFTARISNQILKVFQVNLLMAQIKYAIMLWVNDNNKMSVYHLKYVTKPKKPWNEFQRGDSSRKLMNNLAVKQIMQVHKKGKIVRFTQSNYSPLNKI